MDEGPCQKVHSEPLKAEFQKSRDIYMYDNLIEREFQNRIAEADRVIKVMVANFYLMLYSCQNKCNGFLEFSNESFVQKARARVEEEKTDETINPEINPEMLRVHAEMSRVIAAAEEAGVEGNIDQVQELVFIKLEELQKEKNGVLVGYCIILT